METDGKPRPPSASVLGAVRFFGAVSGLPLLSLRFNDQGAARIVNRSDISHRFLSSHIILFPYS